MFRIKASKTINNRTKRPFMCIYFKNRKVVGLNSYYECRKMIKALEDKNRIPYCTLDDGTIVHKYYMGEYFSSFYYTTTHGEFLSKSSYKTIDDVKTYFEFVLSLNEVKV